MDIEKSKSCYCSSCQENNPQSTNNFTKNSENVDKLLKIVTSDLIYNPTLSLVK